jgi:hypothetical protein
MSFGLSDLKNIFDRPKPSAAVNPSVNVGDQIYANNLMDNIYKVRNTNWYSAKPYGFKFTPRNGNAPLVMFLPISPTNLTISTSFAVNIIPTLYGTVEEHSDVRYYDISIEGTTGFAPRYVSPSTATADIAAVDLRKQGRSSFAVVQGLSLGGFFSKTLAAINSVQNKAADLIGGGPQPMPGFGNSETGYVAFHNLYRFLKVYKQDAAGVDGSSAPRTMHPLTFFNYKDNNEYDCVVRSFVLRRSANDPQQYFYSIQLRCYNLRTVGGNSIQNDLKQRLADLGLSGIDGSSVLGDIKSLSNNAKGIVGAALGGVKGLGS